MKSWANTVVMQSLIKSSPFRFDLTKCGGGAEEERTIKLKRDSAAKSVTVEVSIRTPEAFEVPCPDVRQKGIGEAMQLQLRGSTYDLHCHTVHVKYMHMRITFYLLNQLEYLLLYTFS